MPNYRIYYDEARVDSAAKAASAKVLKARLIGPAVIVETSEDLTTTEMQAIRSAILDVRDAMTKEA